MRDRDIKPKFNIYIIDEELYINNKKAILVKIVIPDIYNGFETYNEAEKWIIENGNRQVDYTILPCYRHL